MQLRCQQGHVIKEPCLCATRDKGPVCVTQIAIKILVASAIVVASMHYMTFVVKC